MIAATPPGGGHSTGRTAGSISVRSDMGLRDRFDTPRTARAILSWRIAAGIVVAAGAALAGVPLIGAIAIGAVVYAGLVGIAVASPSGPARPAIDPFTLGEPWRQIVQGAQTAGRKLRATVEGVPAGPLRERLQSIIAQIDHGIDEVWLVAQQGDSIDDSIRTLDPTGLRAKLATAEQRSAADPSPDANAAVESLRSQLATVDRLRTESETTAASLRLTQTRLDELVARANEVKVGAADTERYSRDVDDMVLQLEALRQAVEETRSA